MNRVFPAFRYVYAGAVFTGALLLLGTEIQSARASEAHKSPSSVQQTMDLLIDPASDALWASVGTEETVHGSHLKQPHTAAEWQKVVGYAQSLVAGAKHLQTPGLPVGANAHSRLADADTPGTRNAEQIRADIDADPARFRAAAIRLEEASNQALTAARSHDVPGLMAAGGALDAACEACHNSYWYPRTPPLKLPSPEEFATKKNRF
jgi:hypothetical protein